MSQNSPAKSTLGQELPDTVPANLQADERIERHLMRQRGAGARAINADFGFSFAGFSAPNSQEATPTAAPSEPSSKRRKTVAEDEGLEQEATKTSALDRRGRTKAARTKRQFVMDADEQPAKSKSEESADREDSFVMRVGAKRRQGQPQHASKEVQEENPAQEASEIVPKAKPTRSKNTVNRGKKAKEAQDADVMVANTDQEHAELSERAPKRRKRAAARKGVSATARDDRDDRTAADDKEVPDDSPARITKSKARSRKAAGKEKAAEEAVQVEKNYCDEPSKSEPEVTPKKSRRTRKATRNEDGDEYESKKAQEEKPSRDETANAQPTARHKTAKASTKSKAAKTRPLAATPPRLERRPLQEADANRSPSPRKSPQKDHGVSKLQTPPKVTNSKQKRNDVVETGAPGQDGPRKSRKLKVQRDEENAQGEENPSADASKCHPGKLEVEAISSVAAANDTKPEQQGKEERAKSDRPEKTVKTSKASKPQAVQSLAQSVRGEDGEEEDVDWLFAASDARPKAVPTKPSAGKHAPPKQRPKLADIDLDDLIANVALFAQAGGPQSHANAVGGRGLGSSTRRGRKR